MYIFIGLSDPLRFHVFTGPIDLIFSITFLEFFSFSSSSLSCSLPQLLLLCLYDFLSCFFKNKLSLTLNTRSMLLFPPLIYPGLFSFLIGFTSVLYFRIICCSIIYLIFGQKFSLCVHLVKELSFFIITSPFF